MENLKCLVKNEAESKEAQDLFAELGYKKYDFDDYAFPYYVAAREDGSFTSYVKHVLNADDLASITIPQLRDMVVLKRNDVGDATHTDQDGWKWYIGVDSYVWQAGNAQQLKQWDQSGLDMVDLEPIKDEVMKEYLEKQSDGSYKLVLRGDEIKSGDIAVPEWAYKARFYPKDPEGLEFENSNHQWWHDEKLEWVSYSSGEYLNSNKFSHVVWQRESLNDKVARRSAASIADAALIHIKERASTYDQQDGERSAAKTAKAFNAITGKDLTESEVWLVLQLLKDVRQWSRAEYHQDSAEDCIAYAALKAESLENNK